MSGQREVFTFSLAEITTDLSTTVLPVNKAARIGDNALWIG